MSVKIIDSSFILNVNPNWSHGRNHGWTDDETEKIADDTYWEMERFYETYRPHKWPEEKPGDEKSYWARVEINGVVSFAEMYWSQQLGWHTQHGKHITHWWNLPEVTG